MKKSKLSLKREKIDNCQKTVPPDKLEKNRLLPKTYSINSDVTDGPAKIIEAACSDGSSSQDCEIKNQTQNYANKKNSKFDDLRNPQVKKRNLGKLLKKFDSDNKNVHSSEITRGCPRCKKKLTLNDSKHWKDCLQQFRLESSKDKIPTNENEICIICNKNLKHLDLLKRVQHLESCLNEQESADNAKNLKTCPLCTKIVNSESWMTHLKNCAKRFEISSHQLKDVIELLERHAEEREALGLPVNLQQMKRNRTNLVNRNKNPNKAKKLVPRNKQEADLQMAMALSVSLQEEEQQKLNKELEELGIPMHQPILVSNFEQKTKIRKKGKKRENTFSLLRHRTSEDRQRIINENVAHILASENRRNTADYAFINEIFTPASNKKWKLESKEKYSVCGFVVQEKPMWNLAALPGDKRDISCNFYVKQLCGIVTPSKVKAGSKLKRLSQIPGRGSSQPNSVTKKSKLEQEDFVSSTQEGLLAVASILGSSDEADVETDASSDKVMEGTISLSDSYDDNGLNTSLSKLNDSEEIDLRLIMEEPSMNFANDFSILVGNAHLSDVNIITKDGSPIPAHSIMFYVRCPKLYQEIEQQRLTKAIVPKNVEVNWSLVSQYTAIEFLRFIYTNQVLNITVPKAEILHLIERYNVSKREINHPGSGSTDKPESKVESSPPHSSKLHDLNVIDDEQFNNGLIQSNEILSPSGVTATIKESKNMLDGTDMFLPSTSIKANKQVPFDESCNKDVSGSLEESDEQHSSTSHSPGVNGNGQKSVSPQKSDSVCKIESDQTKNQRNSKDSVDLWSVASNSKLCTARMIGSKSNPLLSTSSDWQNQYDQASTSTPVSNQDIIQKKYLSLSSIKPSPIYNISKSSEGVSNDDDTEPYKSDNSLDDVINHSPLASPVFHSQENNSFRNEWDTENQIIVESVFSDKMSQSDDLSKEVNGHNKKAVHSISSESCISDGKETPKSSKTINNQHNCIIDETNMENSLFGNSKLPVGLSANTGDKKLMLATPSPKLKKSNFANTNDTVLIEESIRNDKIENLNINESVSELSSSFSKHNRQLPSSDVINSISNLSQEDVWEGFDDCGYAEEFPNKSADLFDSVTPSIKMDSSKAREADNNYFVSTNKYESPVIPQKSNSALNNKNVSKIKTTKAVEKRGKEEQKNKKKKRSAAVTPKPEFNLMKTPEISGQLKKFGLRRYPRKKAILILDHIYESTHPFVTDSEHEASFANVMHSPPKGSFLTSPIAVNMSKNKNLQNHSPESQLCEESGLPSSQSSLSSQGSSLLEESVMLRSDSEPSENTHSSEDIFKAFYNFFTSRDDLYRKILFYEPLEFNEIHTEIKAAGIRHSEKILLEYLDKKGIAFTMRKNGPWKKRRLRKKNSPKIKRCKKK